MLANKACDGYFERNLEKKKTFHVVTRGLKPSIPSILAILYS